MRALAATAALLAGAGCIGLQKGEARVLAPFPTAALTAAAERQRPLALDVAYASAGATVAKRQDMVDTITSHGRAVIASSRGFTYAPDVRQAEYSLWVEVTEDGDPNIVMGVLCGLTLCVVPWWTTSTFTIRAEVHDRHERLGERVLRQELKMIGETFLVFAMPAYSPRAAVQALWRDAFQDLVDWSATTIDAVERGPTPTGRSGRRGGSANTPTRRGPAPSGARSRS